MLMYYIAFIIIGFFIAASVQEYEKAIPIMVVASILWGLVNTPIWGLMTLAELSFGFYVFVLLKQRRASRLD